MSKKIVVVGAGFAGCGAAAAAARAGADVTLVEKTDTLTGMGQLAGSYRRGSAVPGEVELVAMGAGDMLDALDSVAIFSRFENLKLKDPRMLTLYDTRKIGKAVDKVLRGLGVKIILRGLGSDVEMSGRSIKAIKLKDGTVLEADAVVDATGGAGPIPMCEKYGQGCAACIMNCYLFGGRVSIAAKAGVKEFVGQRADGTPGIYSSAVTLIKESLSPDLQKKLETEGEIQLETPPEYVEAVYQRMRMTMVGMGVTPEMARELEINYCGYVNIRRMPWLPREELEKIAGMENAMIAEPHVGWIGNAIRYMAISPKDLALKAEGVDNLFVAGEKAKFGSISAAYISGALAGHNAVRKAAGMPALELPVTTAIGRAMAFSLEKQNDPKSRGGLRLTAEEQELEATQAKKMYTDNIGKLGLTGIFSKKLV
ncbi:MAG: FAD-dependent oxidoreductase [Dehalococcoidales bacterium]|nr:FAD-dependent oxidoreductase [Dehalococcoidales bacterium]